MTCTAELCEYWTGHGCICEVVGIEQEDHELPGMWELPDLIGGQTDEDLYR